MHPAYVTISNLIIDDIVLADGRSFMNTLGGTGTHTLMGMRPWSDALGFVAYCGDDLDPQARAFFEAMRVDMRGVVARPGHLTARAWQLFEHDERRIEIFRTSLDEFYRLRPRFEEFPADYLQARGFHLQWGSPADLADMIALLRGANPRCTIVCEPVLTQLDASHEESGPLLRAIDLFSPDRAEAAAITGSDEIATIFDRLLGAGAPLVALRMGAAGSLVGAASGLFYRVPAVPPAALVDVTGAGNAYCGGFLVGLAAGDPVELAAARAAVSASFAIEQIGAARFDAERLAEAERRLTWALPRVEAGTRLERLLAAPQGGRP